MDSRFDLERVSEYHCLLQMHGEPSKALSLVLRACATCLNGLDKQSIKGTVPGIQSLLIHFNPDRLSFRALEHTLASCLENPVVVDQSKPRKHLIPVYYDTEVAEDLERVALATGLTIQAVIERHQAGSYFVYATGFMPGFAYLGDLDPHLVLPRLDTPRLQVPKGSVAIADRHTAVYPFASPAGWHIIGRCPVPLLTRSQDGFETMEAGDDVRFQPIDRDSFLAMGGVFV